MRLKFVIGVIAVLFFGEGYMPSKSNAEPSKSNEILKKIIKSNGGCGR